MDYKELLKEIPIEILVSLSQYHPKWQEYGFLDEALLVELGKDRDDFLHTEHFRYAMFLRILETRSGLSDAEITQYLELTFLDNDPAMAQAARVDLLMWAGLSSEQFEHLAASPEFDNPLMRKLAVQRRLLERLAQKDLDDELLADCLASNDSGVQRKIVDRADISQEQLAKLAEWGCNRKIRNIAQSRIERRQKQ